ncbi:hypothetical protein [Paraburkholderia sp. SIMBA_030]|uniref:hypothetical protein n=1 Tax=Paraburkholderia sp. SIMBA_030 TaxID=3085773 RepID=UPI003979DC76
MIAISGVAIIRIELAVVLSVSEARMRKNELLLPADMFCIARARIQNVELVIGVRGRQASCRKLSAAASLHLSSASTIRHRAHAGRMNL